MRVRIALLRMTVYLLFATLFAALWSIVGAVAGVLLAPAGPCRTGLFVTVTLVGAVWSCWSTRTVIEMRFQDWVNPDR